VAHASDETHGLCRNNDRQLPDRATVPRHCHARAPAHHAGVVALGGPAIRPRDIRVRPRRGCRRRFLSGSRSLGGTCTACDHRTDGRSRGACRETLQRGGHPASGEPSRPACRHRSDQQGRLPGDVELAPSGQCSRSFGDRADLPSRGLPSNDLHPGRALGDSGSDLMRRSHRRRGTSRTGAALREARGHGRRARGRGGGRPWGAGGGSRREPGWGEGRRRRESPWAGERAPGGQAGVPGVGPQGPAYRRSRQYRTCQRATFRLCSARVSANTWVPSFLLTK